MRLYDLVQAKEVLKKVYEAPPVYADGGKLIRLRKTLKCAIAEIDEYNEFVDRLILSTGKKEILKTDPEYADMRKKIDDALMADCDLEIKVKLTIEECLKIGLTFVDIDRLILAGIAEEDTDADAG